MPTSTHWSVSRFHLPRQSLGSRQQSEAARAAGHKLDGLRARRSDAEKAAGELRDRVSKLDYAGMLSGALSFMMLRQRDAVGLVTFDKSIRRYIPPRSKSGHLHVLLSEIAGQTPAQLTNVSSALHEMADRTQTHGAHFW